MHTSHLRGSTRLLVHSRYCVRRATSRQRGQCDIPCTLHAAQTVAAGHRHEIPRKLQILSCEAENEDEGMSEAGNNRVSNTRRTQPQAGQERQHCGSDGLGNWYQVHSEALQSLVWVVTQCQTSSPSSWRNEDKDELKGIERLHPHRKFNRPDADHVAARVIERTSRLQDEHRIRTVARVNINLNPVRMCLIGISIHDYLRTYANPARLTEKDVQPITGTPSSQASSYRRRCWSVCLECHPSWSHRCKTTVAQLLKSHRLHLSTSDRCSLRSVRPEGTCVTIITGGQHTTTTHGFRTRE